MPKKVYVAVYNDPDLFDEWFYNLSDAISSLRLTGGSIYTSLIPNESWNFYDCGERLKCVASIYNPGKWRIKNV